MMCISVSHTTYNVLYHHTTVGCRYIIGYTHHVSYIISMSHTTLKSLISCIIILYDTVSHDISHIIYHIILHHFYEICMCYLTSYFNFPYLYTISHIISYYHISCISLLYHYYIITNSFVYSMSYVNLIMSYLIPMILFNV